MVIKTFKDLQDDALRWFDEVDDEDVVRENVKQAIAAAHVIRLTERKWPFMKWPEPLTFSTVVGQRVYSLHQEFFRPVYFYNKTLKRYLTEVDDSTFVEAGQEGDVLGWLTDAQTGDWTTQTGSAIQFELEGVQQVLNQPSEASAITISTSSTSDGPSQSVIVKGDTDDGVTEETLTVGSGGTPTTGSVSFTRILRITKVGVWNGTLTVSAGATTILKLFAGEYGRSYRTLRLLHTPTAVETVQYQFYRQPNALVNDNDVPDLPPPFHDLLTYDALIAFAAYNPVESNALKVWVDRQTRLEQQLLDAFMGAESLEKAASYIQYIPRD